MGIVYKIHCRITGEDYYGSTITTLKTRMRCHRSQKIKKCSSYPIIARGDYEVFELEIVEDDQLRVREKYYIMTYPCVNKYLPFITKDELKEKRSEQSKKHYEYNKEQRHQYYQDHKEEKNEQSKKRYEDHKEQIKIQRKQYRDNHKEEINERSKKYSHEHKEEITQRSKKRYEVHKEEILSRLSQPYMCQCGKQMTIGNKARHEQTKFHLDFIKNLTI